MDPRLRKAIDRLSHGSYSLTIEGFARRACGAKPTDKELTDLMRATELPERRVPGPNGLVTVWDYDAP